jgi:hypothetical protein
MSRDLLEQVGRLIAFGSQNPQYWSTYRDSLAQLAIDLQQMGEPGAEELAAAQPPVRESHYDMGVEQLVRGYTLPELIGIATCAAHQLGIDPPSRDQKRKKERIRNWFESNWSGLEQIIPQMELLAPPDPRSHHRLARGGP